jgi:predicted DNA-binding ribbon-helix-helix protein
MMRKRSVTLGGHATSISLEDEFWAELKRMAGESGTSVANMIARIDSKRGGTNLSSALRLAVLDDLKAKLRAAGPRLSEL